MDGLTYDGRRICARLSILLPNMASSSLWLPFCVTFSGDEVQRWAGSYRQSILRERDECELCLTKNVATLSTPERLAPLA